MPDASITAILALLGWIPITGVAFAILRPALATALMLCAAMIFLPEHIAFDFPLLPPLDKEGIASLCVLVFAMATHGRALSRAKPGRGLDVLILVGAAGAMITAAQNGDGLVYSGGLVRIRGMDGHDGFSMAVRDILGIGVPFFIGRALFRTRSDLVDLLTVLAILGLVYSFFMLWEIRMSPRLHKDLYGFHPHSFRQQIRAGGFRPMVFMGHGLAVALFAAVATVALAVLKSAKLKVGNFSPGPLICYMLVVLFFAKSVAAMVFAAVFTPVVVWARPKTKVAVVLVTSAIVLGYPWLRSADIFPTTTMVEAGNAIDPERGHSLNFRFSNEDRLLEKAKERPWFGWGGFSRSRIFDHNGKDTTIADGYWIGITGSRGFVGLGVGLGLIVFPVFMTRNRLRKIKDPTDKKLVSGLAVLVGMQAIDLLPNGLWNYLPYLCAGALASTSRGLAGPRAGPVPPQRAR